MKQEIIYISKLVITSFAILIYLVVLITYKFRKTQNGLLYFYNMLLIFFGIIHSSSILIPRQERSGALCTIQSLMNMLSNMFIRQLATLIIIFVFYQFKKPFRVKASFIIKSLSYLLLTFIYGIISLIYDEFSPQKYTSFCWNSNYYLTACFLFLDSINFFVLLYFIYNLRKNIIILDNTLKTDSIIKYSEKLVKFAILLIISMISSLVNVSIVIVESLGSEALVYYLDIIIQFLDLLSIPPLILIFNFGKNKWMDFIEIICCKDKPSTIFMEQAKKAQQSNQSHDTTMIDESKLLQRSVDVSYDNSNH